MVSLSEDALFINPPLLSYGFSLKTKNPDQKDLERMWISGPCRIRTGHPFHAMEVLYQMS